ncbi:class I SAM-dependent methyltransferase [Streptomyces sp. NBC_01465]|uniref:class I SAM-dependent methyltransferase n=1 Tax=Streptomyces sp. NBC_01465 TaxID=2903878 RepID=UPI002E33130D|nr:class I SAM-dependent methyltransferase [Streptomyces sp. NBC_01465]
MPAPLRSRLVRRAQKALTGDVRRELTTLRGELTAAQSELKAMRRSSYALKLLVDSTGRGIHRMPDAAQMNSLVAEIAAVVENEALARRNATVAYRNVVALEALGVGRLAGGTSNICGKLATVPLLKPPNADILEIGTLYGMFSAALSRMMHRSGVEARLTIVDPLAGSQLQPGTTERADVTGTPVREDVVRANLLLGGGRTGAEARIVQGFSGDPDVRAQAADREYGVIIVDGDHSFEGVLADLEWVEEIVAPGGIVVLDDCGDPNWAGVGEAMEKHLAGDTRLKKVGQVATSAFLRAR